jgi:uncharacterized protein YndB with AHSA1/START domain
MSILYIILILIGVLIAIVLIAAAFGPRQVTIENDIVIDRPAEDVFRYIRFMKNQEHYSKWVMADPDMKRNMTGTDGTTGAVYAWNGNSQAGEGEQEIKQIEENRKLSLEVRFVRPFKSVAQSVMQTTPVNERQTRVTWTFISPATYMTNVMNIVFRLNKMLYKDLGISLGNLKHILEEQA